jgi:hypothetical protein
MIIHTYRILHFNGLAFRKRNFGGTTGGLLNLLVTLYFDKKTAFFFEFIFDHKKSKIEPSCQLKAETDKIP